VESDVELVEAVLNGRREAYAELVRRYERSVRAAATAILRNSHAAEDVAQDAFVTAYQKLGRLRKGNAFGNWILRITQRRALHVLRREAKAHSTQRTARDVLSDRQQRLDDNSEHLLAAIIRLPEHERQAVLLRYFDGHSAEAIAQMIGRPAGTVRVHLSRALARLRTWLEDRDS
jgi:RNA polymerase sigma-70 factor (ECF subfamily)